MSLKLRCKVWLEGERGMPIIGEGRLRILTAVRRTGSISKATRMLNVPYRKAWGRIKEAERELGYKIVEATRTGTKLTAKGEDLVARFAALHKSCQRSARSKFKKVFSNSSRRYAD